MRKAKFFKKINIYKKRKKEKKRCVATRISYINEESKLVKPAWENVWHYLLKLIICKPYESEFPFLGIQPTEQVHRFSNDRHMNVHISTIG